MLAERGAGFPYARHGEGGDAHHSAAQPGPYEPGRSDRGYRQRSATGHLPQSGERALQM